MPHGAYLPDDVAWSYVRDPVTGKRNVHHHLVYLLRLKPGHERRVRILIGEVRRSATTGRGTRWWRAFPEGVLEFPEVFDDHQQAVKYLKDRWEARGVMPQGRAPKHVPTNPDPAAWQQVFGEDPFDGLLPE